MQKNFEKAVSIINNEADRIFNNISLDLLSCISYRLERIIEHLYKDGSTTFITGAKIGFEMFVAEAILKVKKKYPNIKLVVVISYQGEELSYTTEEKYRYANIFKNASNKFLTSKEYVCNSKENKEKQDAYLFSKSSKIIIGKFSQNENPLLKMPITAIKQEITQLSIYPMDNPR